MICQLAATTFQEDRPVPIGDSICNDRPDGESVEGIDKFAISVRHEYEHYLTHVEFLQTCTGNCFTTIGYLRKINNIR